MMFRQPCYISEDKKTGLTSNAIKFQYKMITSEVLAFARDVINRPGGNGGLLFFCAVFFLLTSQQVLLFESLYCRSTHGNESYC
jgi:hypothetical protein